MAARDPTAASENQRVVADPSAERDLVRALLAGSPAAMQRFSDYVARVPAMVSALCRHSRVPQLAQEIPDLVQDCLEVIWRRLPGFEGRAALTTWMFRVCALELQNGLRRIARRQRDAASAPEEPADDALATSKEDPARRALDLDVVEGMNRLGPLEQEIVRLRHFDERTFDEIAQALSLKPSQVRTNYTRALRRLADFLRARNFGNEQP